MRTIVMAMALALSAATPAAAQTSDLSGTWAFQTEPYGDDQVAVAMSGVAVITAVAPRRYDVRLLAQELLVYARNRTQLITARQNCTGDVDDGQISISCELSEPVEGYAPDNFVLQQSGDGELSGVLTSASTAQVTFSRLD